MNQRQGSENAPDTWSPHMTSAATCGSGAGRRPVRPRLLAVCYVGPGAGGRGRSPRGVVEFLRPLAPESKTLRGKCTEEKESETGQPAPPTPPAFRSHRLPRSKKGPGVGGVTSLDPCLLHLEGQGVLCCGRVCVCPCAVCDLAVPGSLM